MTLNATLFKHLPAASDSPVFELNLQIQAGPGITVLFGSSGAGKSLALNCIAGFARPDKGRILVNDALYFDAPARIHLPPNRRRCGYIFQDHALFPHMTVRQNLSFAAKSGSEKGRRLQQHRRINELLEAFELSDLAARKPPQLSGGQKQRAALARTLVNEPHILLLDEPTRGLDARLRRGFYTVLRDLRQRLEIPILLVTHQVEECFELADFVYIMDRGQCLQSGARDAVFARPATVDIAQTLGTYNVLPASIQALDPSRNTSSLSVLGATVTGPYLPAHLIGDEGFLCIRQSDTAVDENAVVRTENQLNLSVVRATPSPEGVRIELEHGVVVTASATEWERWRGHERLRVLFPSAAVSFIGK